MKIVALSTKTNERFHSGTHKKWCNKTSCFERKKTLRVVRHQQYLDVAQRYLLSARHTIARIAGLDGTNMLEIAKKTEIHGFIRHAERQIDQIIAHAEKVSSIFEPHTELISKGKAGVSQKLGPRVCILDDQHQFILHHQVMEQKNDDQVTVSMMLEAKAPFPKLNLCEFGGGLSDQCAGSTWARPVSRSWHHGFKRYVALAVVARNIYRIGAIVSQPALSRLQRAAKYSERKTR